MEWSFQVIGRQELLQFLRREQSQILSTDSGRKTDTRLTPLLILMAIWMEFDLRRSKNYSTEIFCVILIIVFMVFIPFGIAHKTKNNDLPVCSEDYFIYEIDIDFIKQNYIPFRPQDFEEVCIECIRKDSIIAKKESERIIREMLQEKKICVSYLDVSSGRYEKINLSKEIQFFIKNYMSIYSLVLLKFWKNIDILLYWYSR